MPTPEGLSLSGVCGSELFGGDNAVDLVERESMNWNCLSFRFVDDAHCAVFAELLRQDRSSVDNVPLSFLDHNFICRPMERHHLRYRPDWPAEDREFHFVNNFIGECMSASNASRFLGHHDFAMEARTSSLNLCRGQFVEYWVRDDSASVLYRTTGGQRAYVLGEYMGLVPASRGDFSSVGRGAYGFVAQVDADHFGG